MDCGTAGPRVGGRPNWIGVPRKPGAIPAGALRQCFAAAGTGSKGRRDRPRVRHGARKRSSEKKPPPVISDIEDVGPGGEPVGRDDASSARPHSRLRQRQGQRAGRRGRRSSVAWGSGGLLCHGRMNRCSLWLPGSKKATQPPRSQDERCPGLRDRAISRPLAKPLDSSSSTPARAPSRADGLRNFQVAGGMLP